MPTAWRVLDRVTEERLPAIRKARADARAAAWEAGAGPDLGVEDAGPLVSDVDATISIAHSEKENAAATWKRTFGFHPLLAFLDRPEISGSEALAGILRPGNAGSNTAADHITVIDRALEALPADVRPGAEGGPGVLVRSDSAGASHAFANHCRSLGVEFSFSYFINQPVQRVVDQIPEQLWMPAINTDSSIRGGAWVVEATDYVDSSSWPRGTRLILRKERPHPGAQLSFTDAGGRRCRLVEQRSRRSGTWSCTPQHGSPAAAGNFDSESMPAGDGRRMSLTASPRSAKPSYSGTVHLPQRLSGDLGKPATRDGPLGLQPTPNSLSGLHRPARPRSDPLSSAA